MGLSVKKKTLIMKFVQVETKWSLSSQLGRTIDIRRQSYHYC